MYVDLVPNMVRQWFKKQQSLIMNVLTSNPVAYDGVALFSASSRTYGGNTIANYVTTALTATTFEAAYVAMMSYKDHADEPLAVKPDTLVVGPALAKTASDILGNKFIGDVVVEILMCEALPVVLSSSFGRLVIRLARLSNCFIVDLYSTITLCGTSSWSANCVHVL